MLIYFFSFYVIYFCDCHITFEGDISLLVLQRGKYILSYTLEAEHWPDTDSSFTSSLPQSPL